VSTFKRVNSVVVDPAFLKSRDGFLHPNFNGGAFAANLAQENSVTASSGACYRGMPIGLDPATATLVPISASGAAYYGVLEVDITAYTVARGSKIAIVNEGRVRSYAGAALTVGQAVKADTSAGFAGFVPFVEGTDADHLLAGYAFPLDDGSASHTGANAPTPATAIAAGDIIFVDLG
jgi:hypothetical protein